VWRLTRTQTELASPRAQLDVDVSVDLLQLLRDLERAIWAVVVDNDDLVVFITSQAR
jgi:hypothetical protein